MKIVRTVTVHQNLKAVERKEEAGYAHNYTILSLLISLAVTERLVIGV